MKEDMKEMTCPNCGIKFKLEKTSAFRPFCSERCKSIDFGNWAFESHKINGEISDEDLWSEQQLDNY